MPETFSTRIPPCPRVPDGAGNKGEQRGVRGLRDQHRELHFRRSSEIGLRLMQAGSQEFESPRLHAIDRYQIDGLVSAGQMPIVHLGAIGGIRRLTEATAWLVVLLWIPRAICEQRSRQCVRTSAERAPSPLLAEGDGARCRARGQGFQLPIIST
jgi:hypothetical protein